MNNFKFRIWDRLKGRYRKDIMIGHDGALYSIKDNNLIMESGCWMMGEDMKPRGDRFVVMMYTGFRDSRGIKIYEGDLVKLRYKGVEEEGVVEWMQEGASFVIVIKRIGDMIPFDEIGFGVEVEVIGNELIK